VSDKTKRRLRRLGYVLGALALFFLFGFAPLFDAIANRPRGVVPPVSPAAQALHAKLWVADLHADTLMWNRDLLERSSRGMVDVPRMIEGGVALQAFTIVSKTPWGLNVRFNRDNGDMLTGLFIAEHWPVSTWRSPFERGIYQAGRLAKAAADSNGAFTVIHSRSELAAYSARRAKDPKIAAGLLGAEGAQVLEGDLGNMQRLFDAGLRMMAPTHFTDTDVGGSAHGEHKGGLTDFGRKVIAEQERLGILVDLAHASEKTIEDVLEISTKPIVFSHTGVTGTCPGPRNIKDDLVKRAAAKGGVIGIGLFELAVCGQDLDATVRAIRYTVNLVGVEHVALGSDFDGLVRSPIDEAGMAAVTDALLKGGFSEAEVTAIMGGNVQRVLAEVLPE
jgi:microsomal dipeptidase-like Zn-dependent dipeptidase